MHKCVIGYGIIITGVKIGTFNFFLNYVINGLFKYLASNENHDINLKYLSMIHPILCSFSN
jgi:hypothetical protein